MPEITVQQEEIEIEGHKYFVTHIPTATSGCWYTIHDLFEVWATVAIDLDGSIVGWRNPPDDEHRLTIEEAIKKAFGIPE
jgi:hypothetical protein